MVHALDVLACSLVALQVADGFDFTCRNLHEHTGAPVSARFETHVIEFVLDDILEQHVDGRSDVIALNSRHTLGTHDAVGELGALCHTRRAVKQGVQCHLQARAAMDAGTE